MIVNWITAPEVWAHMPNSDIKTPIISAGHNYHEFVKEKDRSHWNPVDEVQISSTLPTIVRGPIQFVSFMRRQYPCLKYVTNFKRDLDCTRYMSNYKLDWFLNADCHFTTFKMLRQVQLKKNIFIRPNTPNKSFTGLTLTPENFWVEMNSLEKISHLPEDELILVSSDKKIDAEFRVVICDGQVVDYSEYRWDNILDIRHDILPECLKLAEEVAKYPYQLDDVYVVDIAKTSDGPKIVEFNSFCSSGLYACDLNKIVKEISDYAFQNY